MICHADNGSPRTAGSSTNSLVWQRNLIFFNSKQSFNLISFFIFYSTKMKNKFAWLLYFVGLFSTGNNLNSRNLIPHYQFKKIVPMKITLINLIVKYFLFCSSRALSGFFGFCMEIYGEMGVVWYLCVKRDYYCQLW